MTDHLNYCRQIVKQYSRYIEISGPTQPQKTAYRHAIDLCCASQKFMLPSGGHLFIDPELRGLDESMPLKLPHKFIALEYAPTKKHEHEYEAYETEECSKRVIFARERDDGICVTPAFFWDRSADWVMFPEALIPATDYIDRSKSKDGAAFVRTRWPKGIDPRDYFDEVSVLLGFLNALSCSNVHIERSQNRKPGKKVKSALQFDDYHILTVDIGQVGEKTTGAGGSCHRSPREHLRRGHIVRPKDRRPYWRNATVVNAGRGFGKIEKDYQLRCRIASSN